MEVKDVVKWVNEFSYKNDIQLNYNNIPLWWFFEPGFCFIIHRYINKSFTAGSNPGRVARYIKLKGALSLLSSLSLLRHITAKLLVPCQRKEGNNRPLKVIVVSYTSYWRDYPIPKQFKNNGIMDPMLGIIIKKLKELQIDVVGIDNDLSFTLDIKTMLKKRKLEGDLWRPIEAYLSPSLIHDAKSSSLNYRKEWQQLNSTNVFKDSLSDYVQNSGLFRLLYNYFESIYNYETFLPILYIETMKRVIDLEKPDLVLMTCATSVLGRAVALTGKLKGIPTMEIQHGIIHPRHYDYILPKSDTNDTKTYFQSLNKFIPDKTFVYGIHHKELLLKKSIYSDENIVVTGQPRYDIFSQITDFYSKQDYMVKYGLKEHNNIFLWAPAFHDMSEQDNLILLKAIVDSVYKIKKSILIIKPHPRDKKTHLNTINKYIKNSENVFLVPRNSDTYEHLCFCNLLITRNSTTAMEAVALNKPILIFDICKNIKDNFFVSEGVGYGVNNPEELSASIQMLLDDDSLLKENRDKYIQKYLYKIDGLACQRVVSLIKDSLNFRK